MKILLTGACGFVGSTLARKLVASGHTVVGVDNLIRRGSQQNVAALEDLGIQLFHGDIRTASDLETLPHVDWVLDCAANASVLAGVDGKTSSRQLVEHNLGGTINLLEFCRHHEAGFILLSTSRVYSITALLRVEMDIEQGAFRPVRDQDFPDGITPQGISERCSTSAPVSLYGATKLASEQLALEYGLAYGFPVWINRCGVMAGAGQFGHPAQGIFAFWIHGFREGKPLRYIGFEGTGAQVRDCLHPQDLLSLVEPQMAEPLDSKKPRIVNLGGGVGNSRSLAQLTAWCQSRFSASPSLPTASPDSRRFDLPWVVLDHTLATDTWGWRPETSVEQICEEIAAFAERNPDWIG